MQSQQQNHGVANLMTAIHTICLVVPLLEERVSLVESSSYFFGGRGDLIFHVAHSSCTSLVSHVRPSKFDVRRLDFVKPTRGVKVLEPKKLQEKFNTGWSQHLKFGCECVFFRRTCGTFFFDGWTPTGFYSFICPYSPSGAATVPRNPVVALI